GVGHFSRNCTVRPRRKDDAYLQTQFLIAQKEEAVIQLQAKEFDLIAATADLDEIEKVNANYILMANLQQASTSDTQTDRAPVYDSDGSAEFLGAVRFRNDHVAVILGVDLLSCNRTTNLYTINLHEMASASPICLMARATFTKLWLWHQRLSHLNFDTINDLTKNDLVTSLPKFKYHKEHLCPSCEQGKSKRASHPPKPIPNSRQMLHLLHMDLCGPMRIASINGKQYVLVIVDDYSCYTWVHFLRSKDEATESLQPKDKKYMETINVTFDELLAMAFKQCSSKPGLQSMTSGQISSRLELTYAPSTITTQQPTEGKLDLLFEAMYDDYIYGKPLAATRTVLAAPAHQDVDELNSQQHHTQQQGNQALIQPETVTDNVLNAMFNANTFVNPFATLSTSAAESSSSQYVDTSNMHTFYQPYPHDIQWTKDHPLEQVIGEPS
nr:ribonuclease H-like domain-containing protein [Tanacetum cinerariifolium]